MMEQVTLEAIKHKAKDKDMRWSKQFGDFAELLVMHVLGQAKNMSVALVDHVGADVFAVSRNDTSKRYAVSVKGRNVPPSESYNYTFEQEDIQKLRETAATFHLEPALALVFGDTQESCRKIRILFAPLQNLEELARNPEASFIDHPRSGQGYIFRWTEGKIKRYITKHFRGEGYERWKHLIDYTELTFDILDPQITFLLATTRESSEASNV